MTRRRRDKPTVRIPYETIAEVATRWRAAQTASPYPTVDNVNSKPQ